MRFRNAILSGLCAAAVLALAACGGTGLTGPTASLGTSTTAAASSSTGTSLGLNHYLDPGATGIAGHPEISCSSEPPRIYRSDVFGNRIDLQWQQIYNATRFELEVQRQGVNDVWEPFKNSIVENPVRVEFYAGQGTYRMHVRNATCTQRGQWSDWAIESIDSALILAPGVTPSPTPQPVQQTTLTFWYSASGSDNSRQTTCNNPGGGQTGTYLGGGWCQIDTPPGSVVQAPQNGNSWTGPYDSVNGNLIQ